jgi:hypothetical protein
MDPEDGVKRCLSTKDLAIFQIQPHLWAAEELLEKLRGMQAIIDLRLALRDESNKLTFRKLATNTM